MSKAAQSVKLQHGLMSFCVETEDETEVLVDMIETPRLDSAEEEIKAGL